MARTTKGALLQRGKTWYAVYYLNGRRIAQTLKTTNRREAGRLLEGHMTGLRLADRKEQIKATAGRLATAETELANWQEEHRPRLPLADAWTAYIAAQSRPQSGKATLKDFRQRWEKFARWMLETHPKTTALEAVTTDQAEEFTSTLAAFSPNRFNKIVQTCRLVFRILAPKLKNGGNPFEHIAGKPLSTRSHRELSVAELQTVCGSATGELRTLFAIGLYTALRMGDAATLRWEEVSFPLNRITRRPMKTARSGKIVAIPLHPTLRAILEETPPEQRKGFVLPDSAAVYARDTGALSKRIQNHFAACGIETQVRHEEKMRLTCEVGFHSLRHSFVTICAAAGVPLPVVQALCGHGSPAIQAKYIHIGADTAAQAVNAMPSIADTPALPAGDTTTPADAIHLDALRRDVFNAARAADTNALRRMLTAAKE
jgi:integrase